MTEQRTQISQERGTRTNTVFDALSHPYRRTILRWLAESPSRGREEAVATLAATHDHDCNRVSVALRHTHLPKLAAAGYVRVDRDAGTVERGPQFDVVKPLLERLDESAEALAFDWP